MKHRIRIELTVEQEARLTALISNGIYSNNSEALRRGLQLIWESYQRDLWLEHHDCILKSRNETPSSETDPRTS